MRNIAFKVIDRLFIVVYGSADPTDEEWRGYLDEIERHGVDRTMQLVITEGGGPTAAQRRYLEEVLAGRTVPVAVFASSVSVRAMVSAMSWVNRDIRAFSPNGLFDALSYLEIPVSRADLIEREVEKLRLALRA
jgi:hypothetical protein